MYATNTQLAGTLADVRSNTAICAEDEERRCRERKTQCTTGAVYSATDRASGNRYSRILAAQLEYRLAGREALVESEPDT